MNLCEPACLCPNCQPLNSLQTEYAVRDLNEDPTLPYEDNAFDVITNAGGGGNLFKLLL